MIDKEYLDGIFFYDEEDGELYYRSTGALASDYSHGRYTRVQFEGNRRYSHHIIWCMVYDEWPSKYIDHKDGNGFNNRLDNIRECGQSQNLANSTWSETRGVEKHGARWRARIQVNKQRIELGSYATKEAAIKAYQEGAEKYFGEFAYHNRGAP